MIQEVEQSKAQVKQGFDRELSAASKDLILDTIQISQYSQPENSTVRELTANAVDSQREKEVAMKILEGKANVEDYFIKREGEQYEDSNWDPDYYDLDWLNRHENRVELRYTENDGVGYCDEFSIVDHGVGLGDSRLEGYFQIGYSTKRNNNATLGAFGFGNKVSLSLRNEYYIMETAYNGKLFRFQCFSKKIVSMIPALDIDTGTENPVHEMSNGYKCHYQETKSKNYTKIIVPCKRAHRSRFRQAVSNQLLYFPNVDFTVVDETGYAQYIKVNVDVIHNSPTLIISNNNIFQKPHIVITRGNEEGEVGVCYGHWRPDELDLQEIFSNVGIKCPIRSVYNDPETGEEIVITEGVSVTPSREQIIWNDETREFILKQFDKVKDEILDIVKDKLKVRDFLTWLNTCKNVLTGRASGTDIESDLLSRMSKLVDKQELSPIYVDDDGNKYRYALNTFMGLKPTVITKVRGRYDYKLAEYKYKVSREPMTGISAIKSKVVIKDAADNYNQRKDLYLLSLYPDGFVSLTKEGDEELEQLENAGLNVKKIREKRERVLALLRESNEVIDYSDITVPDNWGKDISDNENEEVSSDVISVVSAEQKKLIPYRQLEYYQWGGNLGDKVDPYINVTRQNRSVGDIIGLTPQTVIYSNEDNRDALNMIVCRFGKAYEYHLIARENNKYYANQIHVSELFEVLNDQSQSTVDQRLVNWFSAYRRREKITKLEFLTKFDTIAPEDHKFYEENISDWKSIERDPSYDQSVMSYFAALEKVQQYVEENGDEDLQEFLAENDLPSEMKGALIYNKEFCDKIDELYQKYEEVHPFLNSISGNLNDATNKHVLYELLTRSQII